MIRKESIAFFVPFLILAIIFLYFNCYKTSVVFLLIVSFILYFFRDPARVTPLHPENLILAPADGTIVCNRLLKEDELAQYQAQEGAIKLSIFMSVFNVHVNRAPVSGEIVHVKHKKGKKLPVYYEKSSLKNEHMDFIIKSKHTNIFFRLIAGLIAQRIVSFKKEGDVVSAGDRIGLIKFGSRVDIIIPPDWEVLVQDRQKTKAGVTALAKKINIV